MNTIIPADISVMSDVRYTCASCGGTCDETSGRITATSALCTPCVEHIDAMVDAYHAQRAIAAEERANRQSDTRQLSRAAKVYVQAGNDIREMQCNGFRRTHTRASTRHAKRASHKALRRLNRAIVRESMLT